MLGKIFILRKLLYQEKHFKTNNMAQQIKITQTSNADMNIGVPKTLTAVEWLQAEFNKWAEGRVFIPQDILEQAKQMEKEQIIDAHYQGYRNDIGTTEVSEQYYNETFTSTLQGENPSATRTEQ